jgi:5-methyltetrahydropteroyltriglutamate--homocysteine methyltransferase
LKRILPTTLVGSYPQPEWLIDRHGLSGQAPPRVRMRELWRIAPEQLQEAQDDATVLAIRDQEQAGIDIVTDGEMRRESYSNRFATALTGLDLEHPGTAPTRRAGGTQPVPRVVGKIRRRAPVQVRDIEFLRSHTRHPIKMTVPGPFTMAQQAQDEYYGDPAALAFDYAAAVNEEIRDLFAAGADIVQIDEPYLQSRPEAARRFAVEAINRAVEGVTGTTALHLCFGYAVFGQPRPEGYSFLSELGRTRIDQISIEAAQPALDCALVAPLKGKSIILGVLDLGSPAPEMPATVAERIRRALPFVAADKLIVAPDCGMKYLPRALAFAKLKAMAEGAALVRAELEAKH